VNFVFFVVKFSASICYCPDNYIEKTGIPKYFGRKFRYSKLVLKLSHNVDSMHAKLLFLHSKNKNEEIKGEAQHPVGDDHGADRAAA